jgi:hypothetical protein
MASPPGRPERAGRRMVHTTNRAGRRLGRRARRVGQAAKRTLRSRSETCSTGNPLAADCSSRARSERAVGAHGKAQAAAHRDRCHRRARGRSHAPRTRLSQQRPHCADRCPAREDRPVGRPTRPSARREPASPKQPGRLARTSDPLAVTRAGEPAQAAQAISPGTPTAEAGPA